MIEPYSCQNSLAPSAAVSTSGSTTFDQYPIYLLNTHTIVVWVIREEELKYHSVHDEFVFIQILRLSFIFLTSNRHQQDWSFISPICNSSIVE